MVDIVYRRCVVCDELYIPTSGDQKVCSPGCRKTHRQSCQDRNRADRGFPGRPNYGRTKCPGCDRSVPRRDPNQIFCGPVCKGDFKIRISKEKLRLKLEAAGVEWRSTVEEK